MFEVISVRLTERIEEWTFRIEKRVTYSVLSKVRGLLAKLQACGFLNKSVTQFKLIPPQVFLLILRDNKPVVNTCVASVHQKHISVCLFFLLYVWNAFRIIHSLWYSRITHVQHRMCNREKQLKCNMSDRYESNAK